MATPPPIIITAELDDAKLSFAAFRVICHLVRRGAAQQGAWGSIEGMATSIGCSKNTVKTALRELLDSAWITRTSRTGITSLYQLNTQPKNEPSPKTDPAQNLGQAVAQNLVQDPAQNLGHEGVTGRSPKKELSPQPPEGGENPANSTLESTPSHPDQQIDATPTKKENGPASQTDTIRDIPSALAALHPLLIALHRDPRQGLTPQEEHDLLPLLRSPAGLHPADITAIATAVQQRATYTRFHDIPDDSPLRSVRRKLGTLLADWPNQSAIARQITGKTTATTRRDPNAPPDYPWEAVCWHLYEEQPVAWHLQTYRDRRRFADLWRTWTEDQRQTALHRYQNRLTTPITAELTAA